MLTGGKGWAVAAAVSALVATALVVAPVGSGLAPARGLLLAQLILAGLGLGVWLPALVATIRWAATNDAAAVDRAAPGQLHTMLGRTGDPGRGLALAVFPLLAGAAIAGALWSLFTFASPLRAVAPAMWLWCALCLASAYFHATSGWRPLRVPDWVVVLLALATTAAAVAFLLTAPMLLTGIAS